MQDFWSKNILLAFILIVAAIFRFSDLNWDQNQHLHPDERFLTMVAGAMKIPNNLFEYLDPKVSTFNPANVGQSYFVYGTFPVILNKILALVFKNDSYNNLALQGRLLSSLADLILILVVFKTVTLLEDKYNLHKSIKFLAAFFYAIAVLPIQLSHFFTVDIFLNLFIFTSLYFAIKFWFKNHLLDVVLSGLFLGLALASKISSIYMLPLIAFFIITTSFVRKRGKSYKTSLSTIVVILLFLISSYLTVRVSNPYFFQSGNFLDPQISKLFLENIKTLESYSGTDSWFPPAIQWIHKPPVFFSLYNLIFFGVGLPYFLFILIGIYSILTKIRRFIFIIIFLWLFSFFVYQSIQFAASMRYFIFIYPLLAIFAAIGLYYSTRNWCSQFVILALLMIVIWPMFFFSIYTKNHSRVITSEWIYNHIPYGATISCEYWDDCLPLGIADKSVNLYKIETLTLFDRDTPEKWAKINNQLQNIGYIIMSSNRLWGSITKVPEKYPIASQFYSDLFAEKLDFKKVAEITSYPSLRYLGIPVDFPDDWAEEAFTVYDHPKVIIFKRSNE